MSELKRYVDPLLIFSSKSISQSLNSPELENKVDVIASIRALTEIVLSDLLFDLQDFQDLFYSGTSYFGEGQAHKDNLLLPIIVCYSERKYKPGMIILSNNQKYVKIKRKLVNNSICVKMKTCHYFSCQV